jgi:putative hemolysin
MGNMLLSRIKTLKDFFIEVNPFDSHSARNVGGIRTCMDYVKNGGALVIFPAGEISTYKHPFGQIKDKEWGSSILRFIHKLSIPIVPVHITAHNSKMFHLLGQIHPVLRTAMIPHETVNKQNADVRVRIGSTIQPRRQGEFANATALGKYIRTNVYCLSEPSTEDDTPVDIQSAMNSVDIIDPIPPEKLQEEIKTLDEFKLFDHGNYSVYFTSSTIIPNIMYEIGRLREITFRQVGEGTNQTIDTDRFDLYYRHMFVWDNKDQQIVGAYRVGMGNEIMENFGISGFYTDTLFKLSPELGETLSQTIELGRSFIVKKYQRKSQSLLLLWKGILHILLRNSHYRYLMGPVTMSGKLNDSSKLMIINYLQNQHFDNEIGRLITPRIGLANLGKKKFDNESISNIDSIDLIDKLVLDMNNNRFGTPILLKKYLQLNGKIIGFNIDPEFNNAIDSLMLLDINNIPEAKIAMLSIELDIDVLARFRN